MISPEMRQALHELNLSNGHLTGYGRPPLDALEGAARGAREREILREYGLLKPPCAVPTSPEVKEEAEFQRELALQRRRRRVQRILDAEEDTTAQTIAEMRRKLLTASQLRDLPPQEFLVDSILPSKSTGMLFGPPNYFKTFVALGMALAVVEGVPWEGDEPYPTRQANVVYVAGEGAEGLRKRIAAWEHWHGRKISDGFLVYPEPVNLAKERNADVFLAAVRDHNPGLVVFDTLAACSAGADENSARDMGVVHASMQRLTAGLGATVLAIHHSRKDGESYRGSSALNGNVDWVAECRPDGDGIILKNLKMRDAEKFHSFALVPHPVGPALVMRPAGRQSSANEEDVADLLAEVAAAVPIPAGRLLAMVQDDLGVSERTFRNIMQRLILSGRARRVGSGSATAYQYVGGTVASTADPAEEDAA